MYAKRNSEGKVRSGKGDKTERGIAERGDGIKGEKISCEFRKTSKPTMIRKTSEHRAMRIFIEGLPCECYIEKRWRAIIE